MRYEDNSCGCPKKNISGHYLENQSKSKSILEWMSSHKKTVITALMLCFFAVLWVYFAIQNKQEKYKIMANDFYNLKYSYYSGNISDALLRATTLAHGNSDSGYVVMAKFVQAGILHKDLDPKCLPILKEISDNKKISRFFRDYAYAMYANASLDIMTSEEIESKIHEIINTLQELINTGSPWEDYLSMSLSYCLLRIKDYDKAIHTLTNLKTKSLDIATKSKIYSLLNYARLQQNKNKK